MERKEAIKKEPEWNQGIHWMNNTIGGTGFGGTQVTYCASSSPTYSYSGADLK
jgi:hypothetical protein